MGEARGTMNGLVEDLLRKPPSSLRDELVRNALVGRYHDFKSSLSLPKMALVEDLTRFDFRDLARRAMRGEYDDAPDEEDTADLGRLIAEDPDLAELWEKLQQTNDPAVAAELARQALAKKVPVGAAEKS
jgi:hypothetical protein